MRCRFRSAQAESTRARGLVLPPPRLRSCAASTSVEIAPAPRLPAGDCALPPKIDSRVYTQSQATESSTWSDPRTQRTATRKLNEALGVNAALLSCKLSANFLRSSTCQLRAFSLASTLKADLPGW